MADAALGAAAGGEAKAPRGAAKPPAKAQAAKRSLRPLVRALHRDAGYLAVGLTVIYAASGLAVNHIADWDPNFQNYERTVDVGRLEGDDDAVAARALLKLGVNEKPQDVYRAAPDQLEIVLERRSVHLNTATGVAVDEGQKPRFFLRAANWLHLNRGKRAWRYVADAYAAGLLLLAVSGLFMIPGRKGLRGRGGALVAIGAAVPILYVVLSGGPSASSGKGRQPPKEAPEGKLAPRPADLRARAHAPPVRLTEARGPFTDRGRGFTDARLRTARGLRTVSVAPRRLGPTVRSFLFEFTPPRRPPPSGASAVATALAFAPEPRRVAPRA